MDFIEDADFSEDLFKEMKIGHKDIETKIKIPKTVLEKVSIH